MVKLMSETILQGIVVSRRKAPRGVVFLSVHIDSKCASSCIIFPKQGDSDIVSQLVISPQSINRTALKVCCGCEIRVSCALDAAQKNDPKWGVLSFSVSEYWVLSTPRDSTDALGRWKQHPSVEARARGQRVNPTNPVTSVAPPLCRQGIGLTVVESKQ